MNYCHVCEGDRDTYGEMDPGKGVVLKCCECKAAVRLDAAPSAAAPAGLAMAVAGVSAPRPTLRAVEPAAHGPLTASDLLASAAQRRTVVAAALAEMAALQAKAILLDSILAAGEPLN